MKKLFFLIAGFLLLSASQVEVFAARSNEPKPGPVVQQPPPVSENIPAELRDAKITEKLGDKIDIANLVFNNEAGEKVPLSTYFRSNKPVILSLVYFECPNLCSLVLNGMVNSFRPLGWTIGKEFDVITVSIDEKEDAALASLKKQAYLKEYGRLESGNGWHFLTGDKENIRKLAEQVGFGFYYDKESKQFAHSAGIFALTPTGMISRVLYGIDYPERDLKLSLMEASGGRVGSAFEKFLMFCYRYDPNSKGYALYAMRVVQLGALLTVLILAGYLGWYWIREQRRVRQMAEEAERKNNKRSGTSGA